MNCYIFTGRFQPLHKGHIAFLETVKRKHPTDLLLICILRNVSQRNIAMQLDSEFYQSYKEKMSPENNPLPNWERFVLLKLAIRENQILNSNTEIIFRNHPEIDWEDSLTDLPINRIWVMGASVRDKGESIKRSFYKAKGERIECIQLSGYCYNYSGTKIRRQLKENPYDLEFLPYSCRTYFEDECAHYFL